MDKLNELAEKFKDQAPELVKDNKGALVGAVIGAFLLGDNEQLKNAVLGAVAGAILVDNKRDE